MYCFAGFLFARLNVNTVQHKNDESGDELHGRKELNNVNWALINI